MEEISYTAGSTSLVRTAGTEEDGGEDWDDGGKTVRLGRFVCVHRTAEISGDIGSLFDGSVQ